MQTIVAYTDGACSKNGARHAQASWACWFPGNPDWSDAQRVPGEQTNNRGELNAILETYRIVQSRLGTGSRNCVMYIYTDSEYAKNCLTIWPSGWIRRGWVTADGKDVKNRDLIQSILDTQTQFGKVQYHHVRAHTGGTDEHSLHNDRVDRMARRVLDTSVLLPPTEAPKEIESSCPLKLLGPSIPKGVLVTWIKNNMDTLDVGSLEKALIRAFSETMQVKGFKVETRKGMMLLTAGLKVEDGAKDKEDE